MKNYRIKLNADVFITVEANNKTDAKNIVLAKLEEIRKIAEIDVMSMDITAVKNDKSS